MMHHKDNPLLNISFFTLLAMLFVMVFVSKDVHAARHVDGEFNKQGIEARACHYVRAKAHRLHALVKQQVRKSNKSSFPKKALDALAKNLEDATADYRQAVEAAQQKGSCSTLENIIVINAELDVPENPLPPTFDDLPRSLSATRDHRGHEGLFIDSEIVMPRSNAYALTHRVSWVKCCAWGGLISNLARVTPGQISVTRIGIHFRERLIFLRRFLS